MKFVAEPALVVRKQYVPLAVEVAAMEYSSSAKESLGTEIAPVWFEVSLTPPFGVMKVWLPSEMAPREDVAMFVVSFPSVKLAEFDIFQVAAPVPKSVQDPIAEQVVESKPYCRRNCWAEKERSEPPVLEIPILNLIVVFVFRLERVVS